MCARQNMAREGREVALQAQRRLLICLCRLFVQMCVDPPILILCIDLRRGIISSD